MKPIGGAGGQRAPPTPPPNSVGLGPTGAGGAPDPWGVKRAQNLLSSLAGVLSSSLVVTPQGDVSEIPLPTRHDLPAKPAGRTTDSPPITPPRLKHPHCN